MERYNENVSRWRGRLIEHEDVAEIWNRALSGQSVDSADAIRLENLWIDWINTYRSNFSHARTVGEEGLERQAVMSVVALMRQASILRELWEWARPFNELASPNFVRSVEANLQNPESEALSRRHSTSMEREWTIRLTVGSWPRAVDQTSGAA